MERHIDTSHCPQNREVVPTGNAEVYPHATVAEVSTVVQENHDMLGGYRGSLERNPDDVPNWNAALYNLK